MKKLEFKNKSELNFELKKIKKAYNMEYIRKIKRNWVLEALEKHKKKVIKLITKRK